MGKSVATYELNIGEQGEIIVPEALRMAMGLHAGDTITAIQDEDGLIMIPNRLLVPEFAGYLSALLAERGLSVDDLMASGEDIRDTLFRERYGELVE